MTFSSFTVYIFSGPGLGGMSKENMYVSLVVSRAGMLWGCTGTLKTSASYSGWYDKKPPRNGKEEIVFIWVHGSRKF